MWLRLAALAVLSLVPCLPARAQAMPDSSTILSLDDAFARVADSHPDLRLLGPRQHVLLAERDRSMLRAPLRIGAELENALGSGDARGLQGTELTLNLSSVFERGGKLDARRTLADRRIDAFAVERETRRLDLLAETARRYLAMTGAREQREIALLDIAQRTRTVAGARQRLQAGASPESVVLTAQAALARAELDRDRAAQRVIAARQHLAALWGERAPSFDVEAGDPLTLPKMSDMGALAALLERTPELHAFASDARVREARLQLVRSESVADLDWSFGVRRLQARGDFGLVAGVSMPLGARSRAQPAIRAAEAELASLEIEREAKDMALYSTLVEAHGRYRVAQLEVARLRDDVLPKLARAEAAAERAYRAGAISYLEWAQLQSERTAARKQQLEVALDAQRALIELQRLTGQSLVVDAASSARGNTP
ncbi:TolC family protein [Thermomonas carbonis]|uniref:TolC family protein n=1 Tax=Thermomonas carbonis TaxID=1463158 RepID=A0A7G9SSH5_9GAMM|nr:TolC family protein [Thermomonas carbonis]QNN70800.1 TolC family protein [Thermomonas carbonis]GHC02501.1 cation efflux system protein [Thermomonas carbonis]